MFWLYVKLQCRRACINLFTQVTFFHFFHMHDFYVIFQAWIFCIGFITKHTLMLLVLVFSVYMMIKNVPRWCFKITLNTNPWHPKMFSQLVLFQVLDKCCAVFANHSSWFQATNKSNWAMLTTDVLLQVLQPQGGEVADTARKLFGLSVDLFHVSCQVVWLQRHVTLCTLDEVFSMFRQCVPFQMSILIRGIITEIANKLCSCLWLLQNTDGSIMDPFHVSLKILILIWWVIAEFTNKICVSIGFSADIIWNHQLHIFHRILICDGSFFFRCPFEAFQRNPKYKARVRV